MELDVYIGSLHLAFEYQGEQHYRPMHWTTGNFGEQIIRDDEKKRACEEVR